LRRYKKEAAEPGAKEKRLAASAAEAEAEAVPAASWGRVTDTLNSKP
jgi:hypothetical protein